MESSMTKKKLYMEDTVCTLEKDLLIAISGFLNEFSKGRNQYKLSDITSALFDLVEKNNLLVTDNTEIINCNIQLEKSFGTKYLHYEEIPDYICKCIQHIKQESGSPSKESSKYWEQFTNNMLTETESEYFLNLEDRIGIGQIIEQHFHKHPLRIKMNVTHYPDCTTSREDLFILVRLKEKMKRYISGKLECCFNNENCLQKLAGIDSLRNPDKILLREIIRYFSIYIRHARNSTNNLKFTYKENPSIAILESDMLEDVLETSIIHTSQLVKLVKRQTHALTLNRYPRLGLDWYTFSIFTLPNPNLKSKREDIIYNSIKSYEACKGTIKPAELRIWVNHKIKRHSSHDCVMKVDVQTSEVDSGKIILVNPSSNVRISQSQSCNEECYESCGRNFRIISKRVEVRSLKAMCTVYLINLLQSKYSIWELTNQRILPKCLENNLKTYTDMFYK